MRYTYPILLPLILLVFASCASSKSSDKGMQFAFPAAYTDSTEVHAADTTLLSWRDFFSGDAKLAALIETALENNFDLQLALKNSQYVAQSLSGVRSGWLPEVGLGVSSGYRHNTAEERQAMGYSQNSFQIPLRFSWEIDIWGKIRLQTQAAKNDYLRSIEASRAIKSQIVTQVAALYYTTGLLHETKQVMTRLLAINDSILAMEQMRHALGYSNSVNLKQTEAQRNTIEISLLDIAKNLTTNEHALQLLTGQIAISRSLMTDHATATPPFIAQGWHTGVPAGLLKNRPDVAAADYALQAANLRVGIARRNFYPSLTISAEGGLSASALETLFATPASFFGTIGGSLFQPIFQQKRLKVAYEQAVIAKEEAEIGFKKAFVTSFIEVKEALAQVDNLKQQMKAASERTAALEKANSDGRILFERGLSSYIEYLVLEQNYFSALSQHHNIRCAHYLSFIELYRSLGGGVE